MPNWFKKWVLWHWPCPIHGRQYTYKGLDPDASWDAGLLTFCGACGKPVIDVRVKDS